MNPAYLVSLLPALACPLGMGLMMWLLMRTNKEQHSTAMRDAAVPSGVAGAHPDEQLGVLRAQLRDVEAQQASLTAQLGQRGHEAGSLASSEIRDVVALTR